MTTRSAAPVLPPEVAWKKWRELWALLLRDAAPPTTPLPSNPKNDDEAQR